MGTRTSLKRGHESSPNSPKREGACGNCGRAKHTSVTECPATGKKCNKCNKMNHFAVACRSNRGGRERPERKTKGQKMGQMGQIVCATSTQTKQVKVTVESPRKASMHFIVDSGSDWNCAPYKSDGFSKSQIKRPDKLMKSTSKASGHKMEQSATAISTRR